MHLQREKPPIRDNCYLSEFSHQKCRMQCRLRHRFGEMPKDRRGTGIHAVDDGGRMPGQRSSQQSAGAGPALRWSPSPGCALRGLAAWALVPTPHPRGIWRGCRKNRGPQIICRRVYSSPSFCSFHGLLSHLPPLPPLPERTVRIRDTSHTSNPWGAAEKEGGHK